MQLHREVLTKHGRCVVWLWLAILCGCVNSEIVIYTDFHVQSHTTFMWILLHKSPSLYYLVKFCEDAKRQVPVTCKFTYHKNLIIICTILTVITSLKVGLRTINVTELISQAVSWKRQMRPEFNRVLWRWFITKSKSSFFLKSKQNRSDDFA